VPEVGSSLSLSDAYNASRVSPASPAITGKKYKPLLAEENSPGAKGKKGKSNVLDVKAFIAASRKEVKAIKLAPKTESSIRPKRRNSLTNMKTEPMVRFGSSCCVVCACLCLCMCLSVYVYVYVCLCACV